jgi:hypothetical protein
VTVEEGAAAAELVALNFLATLKGKLLDPMLARVPPSLPS